MALTPPSPSGALAGQFLLASDQVPQPGHDTPYRGHIGRVDAIVVPWLVTAQAPFPVLARQVLGGFQHPVSQKLLFFGTQAFSATANANNDALVFVPPTTGLDQPYASVVACAGTTGYGTSYTRGVAHGAGITVAVGGGRASNDNVHKFVSTSTDNGETWSMFIRDTALSGWDLANNHAPFLGLWWTGSEFVSVNERGRAYRSSDGYQFIQAASAPIAIDQRLTHIAFGDGKILCSTQGTGSTPTVTLYDIATDSFGPLYAIANPATGLCYGGANTWLLAINAALLGSQDNGASWSVISHPLNTTIRGLIRIPDSTYVLMYGDFGRAAFSQTAGVTWGALLPTQASGHPLRAGGYTTLAPSSHRIQGTVTLDGAPVARTVRLYDRATGALVATTTSGADGAFEFLELDPTKTYFAVGHSSAASIQSRVADWLVPVEEIFL